MDVACCADTGQVPSRFTAGTWEGKKSQPSVHGSGSSALSLWLSAAKNSTGAAAWGRDERVFFVRVFFVVVCLGLVLGFCFVLQSKLSQGRQSTRTHGVGRSIPLDSLGPSRAVAA